MLDPNEEVRVSIVLEKASTLEAGYSTIEIANNKSAMSYRDSLRAEQKNVQAAIERKLDKDLDVVWNLTLAANIISANVRRGEIAAIKSVAGVKSVYVERQYSPDVVSVGGTADPNMAISGEIDGAQETWKVGYTGEGTLIAIIDTGLDTDHQSFDNGAFLAAVNPANLKLTEAKVLELAEQLNAVKSEKATADKLYRSEKVPFGWNYVDSSEDITHDNDTQGEHGSHVAGIAAANRLVDTDGDGEYEDALEAVQVAGNAPDAQLLIMKVFGKGGGAYDSDCVASIEDAIFLGADAVNLSLGTALPGFATPQADDPYASIQKTLVESDTVVVYSAGNAGSWAENTAYGYLYSDGVSYQFDGESGSYTNSFTVASVDNAGFIGATAIVNGVEFGWTNGSIGPEFKDLDPDATGKEFTFIMVNPESAGHDDEIAVALADEIDGVIYITWRGTTSFYQKGNAAADAGAAGVFVANNQAGTISMNLTGYTGNIPVASILQSDGLAIWNSVSDKQEVPGTSYTYITGTITVNGKVGAHAYKNGYYAMSDFSSWGTTGDLALKPEIAAFGGNIYSVNGAIAGGKDYELMSGTSMAAPQVTGMSALVQQYLRAKEYDLGDATSRAITQGLLMATAVPMKDADGNYYSLLQQGAGLANVLNAVSSPVYITVKGQNDGKVKAEIGDDFNRDGEYVVEFDIHNFTEDAYSFTISTDVFTQNSIQNSNGRFLDYATRPMDVDVETVIGEADAQGTVHVTVTIKLTADEIATLEELNPAGAYVEAFIYVQPKAESDGALAPKLSIPVLGYYGSWTDSSMFEVGSGEDWYNRTSDGLVGGRYPYTYLGAYTGYDLTLTNILYADTISSVNLDKSLALIDGDDAGLEMGAMSYIYTPIRNYGNGVVQVTDNNGKVLWRSDDIGASYGVTYYEKAGIWVRPTLTGNLYYNLFNYVKVDWAAAVENVGDDVNEITVSLILAPEYYAQYGYDWDALTDGNPENGELGEGAFLSTTLTLDLEAPEIGDITVNGDDPATRTITVELTDNKELAVARLYDESENPDNFNAATREVGYELLNLTGTSATVEFKGGRETSEDTVVTAANIFDGIYRLEVEDASGNFISLRFTVGDAEFTEVPETVTISETSIEIVNGSSYALSAEVGPYNLTDEAKAVTWSSADESVATVDENGVVTAVGKGTTTIIASTVNNGADGTPVTAECTVEVFTLPIIANGILGDENGYAKFFEWDFDEGVLSYNGGEESEVVYPQAVATYKDGTFLAVDGDGTIYLLDANGNELKSASGVYDGFLPYDMDYTEDAGFWWTDQDWLYNEPDPFNPQKRGFDLGRFGTFIGLAIDDESSFDTTFQGSTVHVERTIYLLTTDNVIVEIYLYNEGQDALIAKNETDLTAKWVGYGGESYSNMVLGSDGNLYVSIMTGDTNEVYQLSYWETEEDWGYTALKLGNFGDGVWPGLFLTVENKPTGILYDFDNDGDVDADDAQVLLRAVVRKTATEDMDVNGDGKVTTRDVYDLLVMIDADEINAKSAPSAIKVAGVAKADKVEKANFNTFEIAGNINSVGAGDADVDSNTHTVVVPVKASDVYNGLFELNYDSDVLTYSSNKTTDIALTHVYSKDDVVRVGFAGLEKLADDTVVAEITFIYEADEEDRDVVITISVIEEDDEEYTETPKSEDVEVEIPAEFAHGYNFTGLLTDDNLDVQYFNWNTKEGIDYVNTLNSFMMPVVATNASDNAYYVIDYDYINGLCNMYLVNKEDGSILSSVEGWADPAENIVPWDMAYGGDDFYGMWGTYGYYIFTGLDPETPMSEQKPSGWDFSQYEFPYFLGIVVVEEEWTSSDNNGSHSGDKYVLALDDSGYVWKLMPYETDAGTSASIQRYAYTGMPDLYGDLLYAANGLPGTSMVVGEDGALYFSYIDKNTESSLIYRLELKGNKYVGELVGDSGYWVYPALLLDASVVHVWGEPEFTWSEDHTSATATFTCLVDGADTLTVDAIVTSEVKTAATCEEVGTTTYTATVEFNGETYTATKDVDDIPAIGHSYGEPAFLWSEDGKSAAAVFTCEHGCGHIETVIAEVSSEVKTAATCEEVGTTTYTATVEFNGETYTATKDVDDISAIGHSYGEPEFIWAKDGKSASVEFTCENGCGHIETVTAEISSEVKVAATCEEVGTTTYTATVEFNGETYTATKDVDDISATGHSYGDPEITWSEDGKFATLTFTCENGCGHTETTEVEFSTEVEVEPVENEDGTITYTATVVINGQTYTFTLDINDIPDNGSGTPSTGDGDINNIAFLAGLLLFSMIGLYAIVVIPRKGFKKVK